MKIKENQIIGELVAQHYKVARVFKKHNIDFCCKGNRTLDEACQTSPDYLKTVIEELEAEINQTESATIDFQTWPLDLLADYIEKKHHRYVQEKTIEIQPYLNKICNVHGAQHPELIEIKKLFDEAAGELAAHMKKEELILFPIVRKMVKKQSEGQSWEGVHFGTVQNPIQMMMMEHETEGDRFAKIATLSNNYTPPKEACNTYAVTFALLQEFEDDLHLHIHLENNILFPKAVVLEQNMNKTTIE
ncbi:iron-sulfur cluster repair di-iron protein [Reichenbachiella carrageenanivorans]|uniref:Iron-sulfur cluster repair di-iron protein n=1 Tax=Reichenbachiella carrageenanivorans TaxID=2979869 RepID=A0ABY6D021_9BACT|nr:iron-sulfur cluster repair di-iron protein [Reichenbachiella carrageenanivorans]UXX79039.1 iron-sulfur cluster repair di-iron protein [Reichenbachiella carrageenanivorans]